MRRLDEHGPQAIVQARTPVNTYPDFVRYLVQRLKVLCPRLGSPKMAQILCRAGLHLSATTIRRMIRQPRLVPPAGAPATKGRSIVARFPHHVWHVDITAVPIFSGLWTAWLPFALPQYWPFCWWVAVAVDQFSRRVVGVAAFRKVPSSKVMRSFLEQAARRAGAWPRHLITDQGKQFIAKVFRRWCRRHGMRQRFGAVDTHGSLAIIERMNLSLKDECTRRLRLVPLRLAAFQHELALYRGWFNAHRPHTALGTRTPDEVCFRQRPARRAPRFETRARWPRRSRCAGPQALIRGRPGVRLELEVTYRAGRRHLPLVTLKRVA